MVCSRVLEHIAVSPSEGYNRSFVLDYTGCPVLFQAPPGRDRFQGGRPTFLVDMQPMGEADIKHLQWAEHFDSNMIAYSINGDFIPIALMGSEAKCSSYASSIKVTSSSFNSHNSHAMCTA